MRTWLALAALALLAACSLNEATSPEKRTFPAGSYQFTTVYQVGDAMRYETGTLALTAVTADSIRGTVAGNGFVPDAPVPWTAPIDVGAWTVDAYVIHAVATDGIYVWHLRKEGSGVQCTGQFLHNGGSGLTRIPTTCTVALAGT